MFFTAWRLRNLSIMLFHAAVHVAEHTYDIIVHHHKGSL